MMRGESAEPPQTYTFAVALSVVLAVMLFFAILPQIGIWQAEVVVIMLIRIGCLVGLGLGIRKLIAKKQAALFTIGAAVVFLWLSVLVEGGILWGDTLWFLGKLAEEPLYGALVAALLLSIGVIVLMLVRPTRALLK